MKRIVCFLITSSVDSRLIFGEMFSALELLENPKIHTHRTEQTDPTKPSVRFGILHAADHHTLNLIVQTAEVSLKSVEICLNPSFQAESFSAGCV